ncbi:MAG TPA: VWA domain-containing protein [Chitinophagaceae bacterium]|jgi:Ca-activated chloride channel family protein|nr:VWA domain-containing protein [Chitinophagaceae bacterium]
MLYDWFKHIDFAYPTMLTLFAFIPALIWWYAKKYNSRQGALKVSTTYSFTASSFRNILRHLPFVLRLLALSCIILAMARPQRHTDEQLRKGEGIDIVLSIDVSGSMLSQDFAPNRLEVAKQVTEEFIRSRPIDRIGIVIFSGESYTLCPITTDKNTLFTLVNGLRSGMLQDGTLIGEGLATAVDRLSKSDAKSKVVILLTDGKEEAPETRLIDPLTALEIAKSQKVKVYTIGMSAQNPITVTENVGGKRATNQYVDEDLLRRIANETEGEYFRARDKLSLESIYQQIDKMEKSKIEVQSLRHYQEEFTPLLLIALGLLFIELVLRFTLLRKFP